MKAIFLDIDGVLNTTKSHYLDRRWKDGKRVIEVRRDRFDPVGVGLLNDLIDHSEAKVVLSSVWRLGDRGKEALELMKEAGFRYDLFAVTPCFDEKPRGAEIAAWIDAYNLKAETGSPSYPNHVTNYVIFDDESDMLLEQMPHFCQCPYGDGITWKNYCDARRILDIWT